MSYPCRGSYPDSLAVKSIVHRYIGDITGSMCALYLCLHFLFPLFFVVTSATHFSVMFLRSFMWPYHLSALFPRFHVAVEVTLISSHHVSALIPNTNYVVY
jgi:hypothetical protein